MFAILQIHGRELYSDAGIDNLIWEYVQSLKNKDLLPLNDFWIEMVVTAVNDLAVIIERKENEFIDIAFEKLIFKRTYIRNSTIYIEMIGRV